MCISCCEKFTSSKKGYLGYTHPHTIAYINESLICSSQGLSTFQWQYILSINGLRTKKKTVQTVQHGASVTIIINISSASQCTVQQLAQNIVLPN